MRTDQPLDVMAHADKYLGGKALIVLGGPSAAGWRELHDSINPDVVIGANGANKEIDDLDYWLCVENMAYPFRKANEGEQRYIDIMEMFQRTGAETRMVNRKSYKFLEDAKNVIKIRRSHIEVEDLENFSFREYGEGLINGALMNRPEVGVPLRAGTVGLQAIHLAGILGVSEIHTIGFDLRLEGDKHHWYKYPIYEATRFFTEDMFTEYKDMTTLWFWIDTAKYLQEILPALEKEGITWTDHSNGLIQNI